MTAPLILGSLGLVLIAYHLSRGHRLGPAARLVWDLFVGLLKVICFACYIIAPAQIRPTRPVRLLPRPEIPRRRIFKRSPRVR